jgi:hypothetical protein
MQGPRALWLTPLLVATACSDSPRGYHYGSVVVSEQHPGPGATIGNMSVDLPEDLLLGGPTAQGGECDYFAGTARNVSAGPITVEGAFVPVSAMPSGSTPPVDYTVTGADVGDLYDADAVLTITADGDPMGLPGFSGSVQTPRQIGGAVFPTTVSRAAPPTITWVHQDSDEMWFWALVPTATGSAILWCRGEDSGTFTFPPEAFALLDPSATSVELVLWSTNTTTVKAGSLQVDLTGADARGSGLMSLDP